MKRSRLLPAWARASASDQPNRNGSGYTELVAFWGVYCGTLTTLPQDFFLPSESFDLYFLKAKIVILCTKGFEIMDLNECVVKIVSMSALLTSFYSFKSVTIPLRDDARLAPLSKRCDACRPIGMFRSNEDGFLLCYNGASAR
jgi:hypothetical protein